jgi:hypothetical protein
MTQKEEPEISDEAKERAKNYMALKGALDNTKTSNMKQSAVSWLIQNIVEDQTIKAKPMSEWLEIFEQAKAMEKEQMIKFCQTWEDGSIEDTKTDLYNSIYGGEK